MPIVVQHQPSALGIGAVAFQAGLGQYRARQEEMDLKRQQQAMQWAQMALQNQASLRNDMLQAQQMQDANQRFMLDRGMQAQQFATRQGEDVRQFDVNRQAQDQWRVDQQKMEADRLENQRKMQEAGFDYRDDEWARQQAWEAGEPLRKVKEFEMLDAAKLTASGLRTQTELKNTLDNIDKESRREGGISKGLAEALKKAAREKFIGVDMDRAIVQHGTPDEAAAALRADFQQSTIVDENGHRYQRSKDGDWKPIDPKGDALMAQEGKNMAAANKAYDEFLKGWNENKQRLEEKFNPDGSPFKLNAMPESRESWTTKYMEQTFPLQRQATQQRLRQMGAGGNGEAPQQQDVRKAIVTRAQEFAAQGPPEVQQAAALLADFARQFPTPQAQASLPPEAQQRVQQAIATIQAFRAQSQQPEQVNGFSRFGEIPQ